jgi:AraC-like DNA-binding protein
MNKTETLADFYRKKFQHTTIELSDSMGHFNVFRIEDCSGTDKTPVKYSRRDFYKICLLTGSHRYHYADKSIEVNGKTLIFFNPQIPYTLEPLSDEKLGFFCIFTESFFTEKIKGSLKDLPMFALGGKPSYSLNDEQEQYISSLFIKMIDEIGTDYTYKYDLLRNYTSELIHYALKTQPSEVIYQHTNANARITAVFSELLERQFPIEGPSQRFMLRSANDYAVQLSIHVNHLNRAVKETTGKTTTHFIAERLMSEAKALLKHTDWNIADIAYALGFEEPAHFNNFFKKQALASPKSFRV